MAAAKLICFDCDSTLSAIEGIDELAHLRGPEILAQVAALTDDAMDGRIAIESIFARRLKLIQPYLTDLEVVGRRYLATVEPTALATVAMLQARGWTVVIVSGGFRGAIRPLASLLGIAHVEAVDLNFDAAGRYCGFDEEFPTTRTGGKPHVIARLRRELQPETTIMVGDGVSDLETVPVVDRFIGFGRYVARPRVRAEADEFIYSLADLVDIL